ncbi:hypothetical protein FRB90_009903, partial [Tulasnella sp. 427]
MDATMKNPGPADPTRDPTPAEAAAAKTAKATKNTKKRGLPSSFSQAPQTTPAPVGGMSFGFTPIKKMRTRADREKLGKPEDIEMTIAEEEATLEEQFATWQERVDDEFIEDEYGLQAHEDAENMDVATIQIMEEGHPRQLTATDIVKEMDATGRRWIHEQKTEKRPICWTQVLYTPAPTARTAELVMEGLVELENTER